MHRAPFRPRPVPAAFLPSSLAVAVGLALALAASQSSVAQTAAPVEVNIAAQSLAQALNELAQQAKLQILVAPDLVAGKTAPVVSGSLLPTEALRRLLAGSGLEAVAQGGSIVIRRAPAVAAESDTTLPEVRVRASAEPLPGELPKPFAGGQVARGGNVGFLGNRDVFETPFNVTNFTSQSIENLQARRVEDVLKTDPAVRVANVGTGWYQDFMIRGYRVTGNATLFNGLPGVFPQYSQLFTQGIERIEVFKGANTLLSGVSTAGLSIGGTINLVPKRAGDVPLTQITAEYAQDTRLGAQLDVGRRFGDEQQFGARVNVYNSNGRTTIDNEHDRLGLQTVALDYRGDTTRLTLDLGHSQQFSRASLSGIAADPGIAIPPPPPRGSNYQQPFSYSDTENEFQVLRGEWDLTKNVTAYASYAAMQARYEQILPFALLHDSAGSIDEIFQNGSGREWYHVWSTGVTTKFETGVIEHELALNALRTWSHSVSGYVFDEASGSQATIASNLYNPVRGVPLRSDLFFPPQTSGYDNSNRSLALADTLSMFDRRLQLTLGLRRQSLASFPLLDPSSAYDESATTPVVALLYKLTPALSLYGNYIESLEGGPTAPSTAQNRNEVFPPSKDRQREVGVKLDLGTLGITSSVYEIDKPSGILDPLTNVFALNGRQRNRGLEFNVFGEPTRGLRLNGGFVVTDATLRKTENGTYDGKRAPKVSRYNIALGGEWDASFAPGLTLTAQANRSGPVWLDNNNTQQIDAFTEIDLGLRYRTAVADKPLTLRGTLSNAFDANHWVADVYGSFYQSAPRTLRLSATVEF